MQYRWVNSLEFILILNRMNSAKTTILEPSLDGAPEDMKFIGYKDIEEYTKKSYVECTVFKVAVYEDKYGIRHE